MEVENARCAIPPPHSASNFEIRPHHHHMHTLHHIHTPYRQPLEAHAAAAADLAASVKGLILLIAHNVTQVPHDPLNTHGSHARARNSHSLTDEIATGTSLMLRCALTEDLSAMPSTSLYRAPKPVQCGRGAVKRPHRTVGKYK